MNAVAVDRRVLHQFTQQSGRFEIDKVVSGDKRQREQRRDKTLALELRAELCYNPAEQAGQEQHEQREKKREHDRPDDTGNVNRNDDVIHHDCRQDGHGR